MSISYLRSYLNTQGMVYQKHLGIHFIFSYFLSMLRNPAQLVQATQIPFSTACVHYSLVQSSPPSFKHALILDQSHLKFSLTNKANHFMFCLLHILTTFSLFSQLVLVSVFVLFYLLLVERKHWNPCWYVHNAINWKHIVTGFLVECRAGCWYFTKLTVHSFLWCISYILRGCSLL